MSDFNLDRSQLKTLIDNSLDAVVAIDNKARIIGCNLQVEQIFGWKKSEVLNKFVTFLVEQSSNQSIVNEIHHFVKTGKSQILEGRIRMVGLHKRGAEFPIESTITPIVTGASFVFILFLRDISEQKKVEEELQSELRDLKITLNNVEVFRTIFNLAAVGMGSADPVTRKILHVNQKMEDITGYSLSELHNMTFSDFTHPDDREKDLDKYISMVSGDIESYSSEKRYLHKKGHIVWVIINIAPVRDSTGKIVLSVGIIQDVTLLKKAEREALQANSAKDKFLATLSHELRTPITAMLSWAQLLASGKLSEEKTKIGLNTLVRNAKIQNQLINDLLDVNRIQAGKLELNLVETAPNSVIDAAIESVQNLALQKSISIYVDIEQSIEAIYVDPIRMNQILWNLLTNSVKFSPAESKIWVSFKHVLLKGDCKLQIQVRDQGKGISPEFLPYVFERFLQVDSSSTRAQGGLGLGLTIVKNLVELHKGIIEVDSPGVGRGSTFTIYIPAYLDSASKRNFNQPTYTLDGYKILLVDDEADTREAYELTLQSLGAEVRTVDSASLAFKQIESFQPDVLISDIAMPNEDGYALIKKVRKLRSSISKVPALALTAYARPEDINKALDSGFQAHIAKPVEDMDLAMAIHKVVQK